MISFPNVKLNFGLEVLRKNSDGFHDIETLFVPYFGINDLLEIVPVDEVSLTDRYLHDKYDASSMVEAVSDDGKISITIAKQGGVDWNPLSDLCVKAYRLMDNEFNLPAVRILLEKTSPVGAGLGGGSADCAFTILMLNSLFDLKLCSEEMAGYASSLGSDCAFFIYNKPMFGEGRGNLLSVFDIVGFDFSGGGFTLPHFLAGSGALFLVNEGMPGCRLVSNDVNFEVSGKPVKPEVVDREVSSINAVSEGCCDEPAFTPADLPTYGYEIRVIVPEDITVSTADAYKGIVPDGDRPSLKHLLKKPVTEWKQLIHNDFEDTVFALHPELAAIKQSLYDSGAVYASMSGSGSALFGIYPKR